MSDWQPIETAPKDGRRVLLYGKVCSGSDIEVGFFSDNGPFAELAGSDGEWFTELDGDPSHWMPLPEPPQ